MLTCTSCQEQLLDYVYGLFDEADAESAKALTELRTHLASCTACQAALVRVQQQQGLIAEASRVPTTITFSKPAVEPRIARLRQRTTSVTTWYVSAAAVLLAVLGAIAGGYWWGQENRWKPVELARAELSQITAQQLESNNEYEKLVKAQALALKTLADKQAELTTLEGQIRQQVLAKTSFQELVAPTSVESNTDTYGVVTSKNLNGTPAPLPEVNIAVNDAQQNRSLTQAYRNPTPSNKLNFAIGSVAYADKAGQLFNNDITQDISNNVLNNRINHPLQILLADYAAHLCTDKPIYQPGEEVFFRGIALEKSTLALPREELQFEFILNGPDNKQLYKTSKKAHLQQPGSNQLVRDITGKPLQGVGADSFKLPDNIPLGEATLTLAEKNDRFEKQTLRFVVNSVTKPQFNKQLSFAKASFVPGEKATLSGKIKLPTQQPWVNRNFKYQILIDGQQYNNEGQPSTERIASSTDASGNVKVEFTLPKNISKGQGTLALLLPNGNIIETWTQPFRVETGQLQVDCYPEGGELIAGTHNTVYFQLRNQAGEAVDGDAELLDSKDNSIVKLSTFHDETEAKASRGMGKFGFTPQLKEQYRIRTTRPADSQSDSRLPAALTSGVAMHVQKPVLAANEPLQLVLSNMGQPRDLVVSVYCREVMIALDRVLMSANQTQTIQIDTMKPLGGVYRVNVAEKQLVENQTVFQPLAERLIYRHPAQYLSLNLSTVQTVGKPTQLMIDARNEKNDPTPGYVTIVGVNKSLLQMAEASTLRRLPAHFYLAQEVRQPADLEFADFFLSSHRSAPEALDLLLGVQGWRRFIANPINESDLVKTQLNLKAEAASKLQISVFDNRQQMEALARTETEKQVQASTQADELKQAKQVLEQTQAKLQQYQSGNQELKRRAGVLPQVEAQLAERQSTWETYTFWFHLISSCLIAVMSLVAFGAMLCKRSVLPVHLVCTLGLLSLFGIAGAGWLWWKQMPTTLQKVQEQHPMKVIAPTPQVDSMPGNAPKVTQSPMKLSPEMNPGAKTEPRADLSKPKGQEQENTESGSAITKKSENKAVASPKDIDSVKSKASGLAMEKRHVPIPASGVGSQIGGGASNNSYYPQQTQNSQSMARANRIAPEQTSSQYTNRRQNDNRLMQIAQANESKQLKEPEPTIEAKDSNRNKHSVQINDTGTPRKVDTNTMPGGPGGDASTAKDKAGGGGRGAGTNLPPSKMVVPPAPAAIVKEVSNEDYYRRRVYAWSPGDRPAVFDAAKPAWSQTVYWNPMLVLPATGKYSIPIELPADASVYQFDVFGHDGNGRLGARSIDINSPALSKQQEPIQLKTRLSHALARLGDVVQLQCNLENCTTRKQPDVVVKLNIPEGLKLPDSMKQLKRAIRTPTGENYQEPTRFHIKGRELHLIWSELDTEQQLNFTIELLCNKAGKFHASPSLAYLGNQLSDACQVPGLQIEVQP
jgi:hypothetical protein